MRRIKTLLTAVFLLIIIAGCALLPKIVSRWKDERNLGVVTLTTTETLPKINQNDLSVFEKLQLVSRFELQDGTVTVTLQKNAENTALTPADLTEICKRELKKLHELEILPFWNPSTEFYSYNYQVLTYIDMQNPENYVLLWELSLSGEDMYFNLMLDDKTGKIYQFYCWNSAVTDMPPFHTVARQWGEYLGLRTELPKYKYSDKGDMAEDIAEVSDGIVLYREKDEDNPSDNSILFRFERYDSSFQIYFLAESADRVMRSSVY